MALKITFLRLNELLLASVALFVFVYSDSDPLGERVNIWMTHNCTFPPKSLYEEIYPIFVPCFEDVNETLSSLCSSLFTFSDKICIKRPKLRKYFTEESLLQKSNITNICSFAQKYYIGESVLQKYLGEIITDMTSCRNYCEVEEESAFAKICKLLIAGVAIYKESLLTLKAGNHGEKMQSPPPVTKGEKLNETKTQLGSDVKNASLLNTTVKPDIPVASSIENSTPLKNHRPEKEIKTTVSILPATDKQTFVPSSTQDASTFITSTIGTTQPEYLDNHSEENINEQDGSDIEIKTSNDKLFQREPDAKSTETDNQDNDFEDTPDKEGEKKKTKDDSHNKTQKENTDDDSTQKENTDDDSTQKENTDDDSYNKSKNVQGNSDEDQNTENKLVLEDNQEIDQDRDIVPKSGVIQKMEESDDDSSSSSHFMAYFVTALVLCIAGYVIYHNKQKIIAFFLEGRRNGRRRAALGNTKYSKLTPSVEEVMPSLETAASAKNFIY